MVKNHLSRLAMPKSWPIKRKGIKFIIRPLTSRLMENSIPLCIILRDMLPYAKTSKEAKQILNACNVLVNKKVRKSLKFSVGLMDVVEFPKLKTQFRVLLNNQGKFTLAAINSKESGLKPMKITGKKVLKGKKVQLNLDDGSNMLVKEDKFKVNDSLLIDTGKNAIKEHLPLEKGAIVYVYAGKKVGTTATVDEIKQFTGVQPDSIILTSDKKKYETRKEYALVIGKGKPSISLGKK